MEELASLIPIIIIAVISAIAKSSKNKNSQQHPYQQGSGAARPPQARPAAPVQTPPAAPSPARPVAPAPQQVSMASMLPPVQQPMVPTVHTHMQLDCETHDSLAIGSLGVVRTEGTDPCHEEQLSQQPSMTFAPAPEQPGLQLDWSGNAMVKAFVMQEVLARPCDRRRH